MPGYRPTSIVVCGLPAVGKTSVSQLLARYLGAPYVRVDTIEQAIVRSGVADAAGIAGYCVAYAVAAEQLRLGGVVVVECVNGLDITRRAWRRVAEREGADSLDVELVCTDPVEHRRRAENRHVDVDGLLMPTWRDIVEREYLPWPEPHLVIDTAVRSPDEAVRQIVGEIHQ